MEVIVKKDEHILRVYKMPPEEQIPREYCFAGGHHVCFLMVDWFNVIPPSYYTGSEKYLPSLRTSEDGTRTVDEDDLKAVLIPFIREKNYYTPSRRFVCISVSGWCFTM